MSKITIAALFIAAVLGLALYLNRPQSNIQPLPPLPPDTSSTVEQGPVVLNWLPTLAQAKEAAKTSPKPILVKIGEQW